jgi:hypothetical protein
MRLLKSAIEKALEKERYGLSHIPKEMKRWEKFLTEDPYNPNLTLRDGDFGFRV